MTMLVLNLSRVGKLLYRVAHLVAEHSFVDIKIKVPPQYELLILKRNSYFNVNISL